MARSIWIAALVGMLAYTAPSWAQVPQERIVTVREEGKPPQRCRVLKCWTEKDGRRVCHVQNVDTHEIMTIMDGKTPTDAPLAGGTSTTTRVYHWGSRQTPPGGIPVAPPSAVVFASPVFSTAPSSVMPVAHEEPPVAHEESPVAHEETPAAPAPASKSAEKLITVDGKDGVPQKCRVLKESIEKDGTKVSQCQVVATGEVVTFAEPRTGTTGSPKSILGVLFHQDSPETPKSITTTSVPVTTISTTTVPTTTVPTTPVVTTTVPTTPVVTTTSVPSHVPSYRRHMGSALDPTPISVPSEQAPVSLVATPGPNPIQPPVYPLKPAPSSVPSKSGDQIIVINEPSKPAQKCRVLKEWVDNDGSTVCQLQVVETREIVTLVEPHAGSSDAKSTARVFHWKSSEVSPPGAPAAPPNAVVRGTPLPPTGLLPWVFSSSSTRSSTVAVTRQPAVSTASLPTDEDAATTPTEPALPKNWQKSWGKTERWNPDDSNQAVADSVARAEQTTRPSQPLVEKMVEDPLKKPIPYVETLPSTTTTNVLSSMHATPAGNSVVTTTLASPMPAGTPLAQAAPMPEPPISIPSQASPASMAPAPPMSASPAVVNTPPAPQTTVPTPLPPLAPPAIPYTTEKPARPTLWHMLTSHKSENGAESVKVVNEKSVGVDESIKPATAPKTMPPLGMGSVLAVNSAALDRAPKPIGQMTMVDGQPVMKPVKEQIPPGMVSVPVTAPNAFTVAVGTTQGIPGPMMVPGPMMMPPGGMMPPGAMVAQGVPAGMGNAFTTGGTSRPIPAEYGMPAQEQNAFETPGMSAMAARPPMPPMPPPGYYPYPMPMQPMPPQAVARRQEPPTGQLTAALRDSILPSEREMAAEQLSHYDGRTQPQVVAALVAAAKADPAPAVRASCVRALAKLKVNTMPVVQTVQELRNDQDIRVRQEVEQALLILSH